MRVLLDTVTFLWAVSSPERVSRKAMSVLGDGGTLRQLSVISLTEIAIKSARGKLTFDKEAVMRGVEDLQLQIVPYTAKHAYTLFDLPLHHADPFDRQLIAQALAEDLPIVTSDRAFGLYRNLKILW
ncbi:MAG TPA: type II toxin-antitoxin system VapC family toxin [Candidatus Acidoferrum sp.]|nr:type II toxin-antitoxin system VapC family toxin [Candidatus Acidoferrum sp.]